MQNKRGARAEQGQPRSRKGLSFFIGLGAITHRARIGSLAMRLLRAADDATIILAYGFSCREQIEQANGRPTMHVVDPLAPA